MKRNNQSQHNTQYRQNNEQQRPQHNTQYYKHKPTSINTINAPHNSINVINKEHAYKIRMEQMRNYFMGYETESYNKNDKQPLKLSYDNIFNATPYEYNVVSAIPCGIKGFCWIYNDMITNQPVIEIIPINNKSSTQTIHSFKKYNGTNIHPKLTYGGIEGTILYGTLYDYHPTHHKTNTPYQMFFIEDIFYFKGNYVSYQNWNDKFIIYKDIFTNYISQTINTIHFILPFMCSHITQLIDAYNNHKIPYDIDTIQYKKWKSVKCSQYNTLDYFKNKYIRNNIHYPHPPPPPHSHSPPLTQSHSPSLTQTQSHSQTQYKPQTQSQSQYKSQYKQSGGGGRILFWVKPDLKDDIYHLYKSKECNKENYAGLALIPNYITSVKMNSIFRTIKENKNLDTLEESDDEDEFENINDNKFVNVDKCESIYFLWNSKFHKYYPIL